MQKHFTFNKRRLDLDLTYRCPLECGSCSRQAFPDEIKKGHDMTVEDFKKCLKFASNILFSGTYSDPIHHPQFIEFLKMSYNSRVPIRIETASSFKSEKWFIKAFKANPNAKWQFGIDGLPEDSHKYRKNQDGKKLFGIMLLSKKYLKNPATWQYIAFNYNEEHIEWCKSFAKDFGLNFKLIISGKYKDMNDTRDFTAPTMEKYILPRNDDQSIIKDIRLTYE